MAAVSGVSRNRVLAIEASSLVDADVDGSGNLVFTRHDGSSFVAGLVKGAAGSNGRSILSAVINGAGELVLTYSDSTVVNLGRVEGTDGEDAAPGSTLVVPDTTVVRTNDGRAKFATPTSDEDGATKLYVDQQRFLSTIDPSTNLDAITTNGRYIRVATPSAGLNYPILIAGFLEVMQSGLFTHQRYTPYGQYADEFYTRTKYSSTWYPWRRYIPDLGWQSYAVALQSATGTNPTMGNSVVVGRYCQSGKTVQVNVDISIGSTFSVGTGLYRITLPVSPSNAYHQSLSLLMTLSGDRNGHARIEGSSGNQRLQVKGSTEALVTIGAAAPSLVPISGTRITIYGSYEAA